MKLPCVVFKLVKVLLNPMKNFLISSKLNHTMPHTICNMSLSSKNLYVTLNHLKIQAIFRCNKINIVNFHAY